jgi:hypothetical protein
LQHAVSKGTGAGTGAPWCGAWSTCLHSCTAGVYMHRGPLLTRGCSSTSTSATVGDPNRHSPTNHMEHPIKRHNTRSDACSCINTCHMLPPTHSGICYPHRTKCVPTSVCGCVTLRKPAGGTKPAQPGAVRCTRGSLHARTGRRCRPGAGAGGCKRVLQALVLWMCEAWRQDRPCWCELSSLCFKPGSQNSAGLTPAFGG